MNSPIEAIFPAYIDSTMLASFRSCPRSFYNEFILGLRPKGTSWDLHAGAAFARGLEQTRHMLWSRQPLASAVAEGIAALTSYFGIAEPPEGKSQAKSWLNLISAFAAYWNHFGYDTDPYKIWAPSNGDPGIEFSFAIPLPIPHPVTGDPLIYCGRFDALVEIEGLVYALDDKTTSSLGANWVSKWKLRGQFLGYVWACQQLGYPIQGYLVRGIGLYANGAEFLQYPGIAPDYLIQEWYDTLLQDLQRMVALFQQTTSFPKVFSDACHSYSGCPFLPICHLPFTREHLYYDEYQVSRWDPLALEPLVFTPSQEASNETF